MDKVFERRNPLRRARTGKVLSRSVKGNGMAADYSLCCRGAPAGAEAPGGRRLGARADRLLARRREIPIPSRLMRGEGPFDVWKLAKDARKLALYACGRGRADGLGGRREQLNGSTTSPRTTSQLRSTRDGSLVSTLSGVCGLSTGHLGWAARPERAASAAMGRPELLLRRLAALRSRGGRRLARRATGECSVEPGQQVLGRCSSCGGLRGRPELLPHPHMSMPHPT